MALTKVSGEIIQDNVVIAGILTATNLKSQQLSVTGVSTVGSLSIGNTSVISAGRQLQNIASLDATTTATIESAVANAPNTFTDLNITGISTLGVTSTTNLTSQQLNVSGISTLGSATASSLVVSGISTLGITSASSLVVSGISTLGVTSTTNLTAQSLSVSGISTFTNGPVLVGTATSTGTASQPLQVTGGAYVSGSVGIGTTNPQYETHLYGNKSSDVAFVVTNKNATSTARSYIGLENDVGGSATISFGSTSYTATGPFRPSGFAIYTSGANSSGGIAIAARNTAGYIDFYTGRNNQRAIIDSSGNLGIGTTNPSSKLQINYSSSTAYSPTASPQTVNSIALFNTDTTATTTFSSIVLGNRRNGNSGIVGIECVGTGNDATALTFKTQSAGPVFSEVMRLTSTGRIGIGTDSIADKVVIVDSMVKTPSSAGWGIVVSDSNTDGISGRGGAIAFGARRTDGGQFNCGAISGAKSNSTGMNENGDLVLWSSVSSSLTERMRILSGGNVGVGISDPSYKLDVYGEFRVRGTASTVRSFYVNTVGKTSINIANNDNETNLVLDNVGDITSTTNHGSNILFRTNDNNSATTAIDSGKISVIKTQQWTSTASTRNSSLEISVSKGGSLQNRLRINGDNSQATFFVNQRSNSSSEDASLANHQYLFVEPDGDGPGYYRRSVASQYKGFNQYSYWAIRYDGASYDYTGSMKCRITWSTSHASGAGFAEFSLAVRSGDSDGGPAPAGNIIQYGAVQYSGGWFYGWTVNPDFDVYYATFTENKQFLVLRLNGYMTHNGGGYDGGVHETVDLESWGYAFQGLYRIGTTAPSGFTLNAVTKTILT